MQSITLATTTTDSVVLSPSTINTGTPIPSLSIGSSLYNNNVKYGGVSQTCYNSNLQSATLSNQGLYFGRNLAGEQEYNIVATSSSNGIAGQPSKQQMLGIYTSTTDTYGSSNADYIEPVVSLNQNYLPVQGPSYPGYINNLTAINSAVVCGQANYGYEIITEDGLYFCRNITGGNNEYDIVAVNTYAPGNDLASLNIYTSRSGITGTHSGNSGYTGYSGYPQVNGSSPLISMYENLVQVKNIQCPTLTSQQYNILTFPYSPYFTYPTPATSITANTNSCGKTITSNTFNILNSNVQISFTMPGLTGGPAPGSTSGWPYGLHLGTNNYFITLGQNNPDDYGTNCYYANGADGSGFIQTPDSTGIIGYYPYAVNDVMTIQFNSETSTATLTQTGSTAATFTVSYNTYGYTGPQGFYCAPTGTIEMSLPITITGIGGSQWNQSTGASGQVITANGLGGWNWIAGSTPVYTATKFSGSADTAFGGATGAVIIPFGTSDLLNPLTTVIGTISQNFGSTAYTSIVSKPFYVNTGSISDTSLVVFLNGIFDNSSGTSSKPWPNFPPYPNSSNIIWIPGSSPTGTIIAVPIQFSTIFLFNEYYYCVKFYTYPGMLPNTVYVCDLSAVGLMISSA